MSKRLIRNSAFGLIGSLTTTFGSFASNLIMARALGVEGTGIVTYAIWLATTAVTLSSVGVPFTLGRYLPELQSQGQPDAAAQLNAYLLRPYAILSLAMPLALVAYAFALPSSFGDFGTHATPTLWFLIAACALTQSMADFARGHLRGVQKFDYVAKASFVSAICQPFVIWGASRYFGPTGALSGYIVGNAISALLIFTLPKPLKGISAELRSRVLRCASYRWLAEIMAAFVWSRLEVFFLQLSWGSGSIGLFNSGLTLSNLAVQLPVMLTWGLIPHFAERVGRKEFDRVGQDYQTGTRMMAFMLLPSCIGLSVIMPVVLPLLYGPQFADATTLAIILVCGAGLASTTTIAWNVIWAMERTDIDLFLGVIGAIVALIGDLTIIPTYGPVGAAISRVAAQSTVSILTVLFVVRSLRISLPIMDLGKILISALACGVAARLSIIVVPGPQGLPLAISLAVVVYLMAIRITKALPESDIARFRSLALALPPGLSAPAHRILNAFSGRGP